MMIFPHTESLFTYPPEVQKRGWWQTHWDNWVDRWVAKKEYAYQQEYLSPSADAIEEAYGYYEKMYVDFMPDPYQYRRLLRRRGLCDWKNPFIEPDLRHYEMHKDGFLWADVELLATHAFKAMQEQSQSPPPEGTLAKSEYDFQHQCVEGAEICWIMALTTNGGKWPQSLQEIHPDNLEAITLTALLNPHLKDWGVQWEPPPKQ